MVLYINDYDNPRCLHGYGALPTDANLGRLSGNVTAVGSARTYGM